MEKEGVVVVEVESGGQLKYMYLFFGGGAAKVLLNFPSNRRRGRQKKSGSFIGYNYL